MPLFVSNTNQSRTGVFAMEIPPPASVTPVGTGTAVIVGQFPWGPANKLTYPDTMGAFFQTYAPMGCNRVNSAHLSVIRKAWPRLGAVRAIDPTAVAATAVISKTGPTTVLNVTAAYPGTTGNSIVLNIGAASDGNANHFNLTASLSGTSGTTTEVYPNLNISGTGADVLPNLANSVLLASVTKAAAGVPITGNTTMSGGTAGTIASTQYVGTPGAGDYGFALLENDTTIDHLFVDDPGNTLRPGVNNGLVAHVQLTTNKIGYINGNSGQTASAAQTDVASYRDTRIVYVDPWAYVYDDTTGAQQLVPSACWGASVAAQIPPSLDIGYRSTSQLGMLAGVAALEFDRGSSTGQNTASGITTMIKAPSGGITFERGVNTSTVSGEVDLTRSRMGIYVAKSVTNAWQPYVNAPNVSFFQQDLINSLEAFLAPLKRNAGINPAVLPYIVDYTILPPGSVNTAATIALGQYTVAAQIQTGASMNDIFVGLQYGPTVTILAA